MLQEDQINSAIKEDSYTALRLNVLMTESCGLMDGQWGDFVNQEVQLSE